MKKLFTIFMGILIVGMQLAGCRKTEEVSQGSSQSAEQIEVRNEAEVTKLVWQNSQYLGRHQAYFNQVLKEKNLPYEVEFIEEGSVGEGKEPDLREVPGDWENTYDLTEEILNGEFRELDEYLDTEEGKVIKESLPENVWDTYKVNGKQYTVLSVGFVPAKTVYIWDKELAEKYDVHPEEWSEKIWEHEEELQKVCEGEKGQDSFVTVEGLRLYSEHLKGMTQILGVCYPLVIQEMDETPKAALLYETPEYQEYLAGIQRLYEKGIYNPGAEENVEREVKSFLKIDTDFKTKDSYLAWQEEDFWDTHEVKELWKAPLWRLAVSAQEVGITSGSQHPEEAFSLLCKLYEDAELTNALMWGEEGKDYEVRGNTAVKPIAGGYIPALYVGNNFAAYAEVGQDEQKKELYPEWLKECGDSKINGFDFSGKGCMEELAKLYQIYGEQIGKSGQEALEQTDAFIQQCREAGADKVIEEWNRQYREWRETHERMKME